VADRPVPGRWRVRDAAALAGVTVLAGILRFWHLGNPPRTVFDETYYAHDACVFVKPASVCRGGPAYSEEHPLLAKWLIAAGIKVFGFTPFGWRVVPATFGTLAVALTFLLAWRLLGSTVAATLAGGAFAIDGLAFVQSRVAMLDVFVTTFSLTTILCVVMDRDRDRRQDERLRDRPWLLAAGVTGGAAMASKWSGIPFLAMAVVLVLVWDRRQPRAHRGVIRADLAPVLIFLVAVPLAVYVLSFAGRLDGSVLAVPWDRHSWAWAFVHRQAHILGFHADLRGPYPYESPAWSWPLLKRPVVFAFEDTGGTFREILALGNPVVWWGGSLAVVVCAARWIRGLRSDRIAGATPGPEGVLLAGVAAGYLWWLPATSTRTFSFLFYFLPAVPFLCIALVRVGQLTWGRVSGRAATGVVAVAAVVSFAFFLPVLTYRPLNADAWASRLWFRSCDPVLLQGDPPHPQSKVVTGPPKWWCWV